MAEESQLILAVVKISCMILFFALIAIVGSIPIRLRAFKSNKKLLSFTAAFSGGLFLSVGLIHLLPEAVENFEDYYTDGKDHFPFAFLITILSFSLILFIEKIATDHKHAHDDDEHNHQNKSFVHASDQNQLLMDNQVDTAALNRGNTINQNNESLNEDDEQVFKEVVSTQVKIAKRMSFVQAVKKSIAADPKQSVHFEHVNTWAPYILQIAIGIHAVFEGLSIGIQQKVSLCLGISAAVLCHKWAEGLTLGLAFRQAGVDKQTSTIMILIQAIMNPVGIAIGWSLSSSGPLITGTFVSISVGTFVYISTIEVIVEEFNIGRYKWQKFFVFLAAIGFVCSFWFLEQLTEHKQDDQ